MAKILMVGIDPELVDFSDPALPPGMNADVIRQGIARGRDDLRAAGHEEVQLYIPPDPDGLGEMAHALANTAFDCVIVGGGVRIPPRNLALFEAVLNMVVAAPNRPKVALVATPSEAAQAVARALS